MESFDARSRRFIDSSARLSFGARHGLNLAIVALQLNLALLSMNRRERASNDSINSANP